MRPARACSALAGLVRRHAGQRLLVVGHQETVEAAHTLLLGLPAGACTRVRFVARHASLARWQWADDGRPDVWLLAAHNDTAHLA